MLKKSRKSPRKRIIRNIVVCAAAILALFLIVQAVRCHIAVGRSQDRLRSYGAKTTHLSYGAMTYVDKGQGNVVLSAHGLFGGYDQAHDIGKSLSPAGRIIAPSRFGYLGSEILGDGTPAEQPAAYVELLDELNIEKAYVLGTSAGGTVAIRFALDYPERTKGLILNSSAMPVTEKPKEYPEYAGPPRFLINNYGMFLTSPLFEPLMGMPPSTIDGMLPIDERKVGVELDASISNIDMSRNFDSYPIESLQVPILILQTKDDKVTRYEDTQNALSRFPNPTFISFETGGHMMVGHSKEIVEAVADFMKQSQ